MSDLQFFYVKNKDGHPRHIVVATGDEVDGKMPIQRLGLHPSVEGKARRGNAPKYRDPVSVSDLYAMPVEDVPEDLQSKAVKALAPAVEETVEAVPVASAWSAPESDIDVN